MLKQHRRFNVQQGWKVIISDMGVDPIALLKLAKLPEDLFHRVDATLSADDYFNLWSALEQLADKEKIPLLVGQHISVESFDPPVFAALCSPNLTVAFERLASYKRLIGPINLGLTHQSTRLIVEVKYYGNESPLPGSIALTELAFLLSLARLGTRYAITPLKTIVPQLPSDVLAYQQFFGSGLSAGESIQLHFSSEDANRPFITHNLAMWQYFEQSLQKQLEETNGHKDWTSRVKNTLLELIPSGRGSIEEVARSLALSKRSLQRKLGDEGTAFKVLVHEVRQQLAEHYLKDETLTFSEIAFLLGFNDSNSFYRAFNQWTGLSPGQFRSSVI